MKHIFDDEDYDPQGDPHMIDASDPDAFSIRSGYVKAGKFIECNRCGCKIIEPRFWIFIECPGCHYFIHNEE